jgi:hypothetical protein
MSVTSFIRNTYDPDTRQQAPSAVLVRMLLILFGGLVVAAIAVALVLGVAALIWGGTIVSLVQQVAGA